MIDLVKDQIEGLKKTLAERKNASSELKLDIVKLQGMLDDKYNNLIVVERTIGALEGALVAFTGGRDENN